MRLRPQFHLLTILFFILSAVPVWLAVRALAENILEQWAERYAERLVLYDKGRMLQPILRELALSRQLAASAQIRDWAKKPDNAELRAQAIGEMESFRLNFHDQSYFVALLSNGQYYHNNRANEFANRQYRYDLDPKASKDAWFYDLIRQGRDIHINVNPDPALGITKLWIDVLIRDGNDILGIAGTGLDLTEFIDNIVHAGEPGVTSLFLNHAGAIQVHRDQSLIDFGSISNGNASTNTINRLFDHAADITAIRAAMQRLQANPDKVLTEFVQIDGRRHLAGLAYIPEIEWYEMTLLDLDVLLPFSQFSGILMVYGGTLLSILLLFNYTLGQRVLKPLARLDQAMTAVESGQPVPENLSLSGSGEIRSLLARFNHMADSVAAARHELEAKVEERTAALQQLATRDTLTTLFNRRGMSAQLLAALERARRENSPVGILWLDVDNFKLINDQHGHATGDRTLIAIAEQISNTLRPYDIASRWGGDEFLILLHPTDTLSLHTLADRLRSTIAAHDAVHTTDGATISIRVSIGGTLSQPEESLDTLLQRADEALYAAKADGRNRVCIV